MQAQKWREYLSWGLTSAGQNCLSTCTPDFSFLCLSCLYGITGLCWWTVTSRSFSENAIVLRYALLLSTAHQPGLLDLSQMNLILFSLSIVFLIFLISICTNAVLLQLQFLSPSAAYFQFSYRIINGTQNWCGPRIEYLFDTSLHPNGHNSPVRRCLLHIFMSLTAFAVFYRNAAGNRI